MLKIFKYLKKSFLSVIVIILLLIVQAWLDLTLPEYTSKIINVGVQQNGIENAAIEKIGKTELDNLTLLMTAKDKKYIMDNYQLTKKDTKEPIINYKKRLILTKLVLSLLNR